MNPDHLKELTRQARRIDVDSLARTGRKRASTDTAIEGFLTAFHAETLPFAIQAAFGEPIDGAIDGLARDFLIAVVNGDAVTIRRMADAVARVSKRSSGYQNSFRIEPVAPYLKAIAAMDPAALSTKAILVAAKKSGVKITTRTAQRLLTSLRGEKAKRGRPKK